jgi:hypothetical protein
MPATSFWTPGLLEEGGLLLYPSPQGAHTQVYKLDSWRKGASFSTPHLGVLTHRYTNLTPGGRGLPSLPLTSGYSHTGIQS